MKIIVTEDIVFIREELVHVLSALHGIEVVWNGPTTPEVVEATSQTQADVVILNIALAQALLNDMIFDTISALRQLEPRPYIIVLGDRPNTAVDKIFSARILGSGADHYLNRSLEMIKLPRLIQNLNLKTTRDTPITT